MQVGLQCTRNLYIKNVLLSALLFLISATTNSQPLLASFLMFSSAHSSYFSPVKFSSTTQQFFLSLFSRIDHRAIRPPTPRFELMAANTERVGGHGEKKPRSLSVVNDFSGRRSFFLQWSPFSCCLWQVTKRCYGWQKRIEKKTKKKDAGDNAKRSGRNWEKCEATKRHF